MSVQDTVAAQFEQVAIEQRYFRRFCQIVRKSR
jgi:hypothetical protein